MKYESTPYTYFCQSFDHLFFGRTLPRRQGLSHAVLHRSGPQGARADPGDLDLDRFAPWAMVPGAHGQRTAQLSVLHRDERERERDLNSWEMAEMRNSLTCLGPDRPLGWVRCPGLRDLRPLPMCWPQEPSMTQIGSNALVATKRLLESLGAVAGGSPPQVLPAACVGNIPRSLG